MKIYMPRSRPEGVKKHLRRQEFENIYVQKPARGRKKASKEARIWKYICPEAGSAVPAEPLLLTAGDQQQTNTGSDFCIVYALANCREIL